MAARSAIVPQTQLSSSRLKHETSVQIISVPCSDIRWDSSCKRALTCQLAVVYCLLKRFRRPHHQRSNAVRFLKRHLVGRRSLSLADDEFTMTCSMRLVRHLAVCHKNGIYSFSFLKRNLLSTRIH